MSYKDVANVIRMFYMENEGDEATCDLILAIGAELLNVSMDAMMELIDVQAKQNIMAVDAISKDMIREGYTQGVVRLIISPHNDGIACQIGENWFYFGGYTAEEYDSVEDYRRDIPVETIVDEIYDVLDEFSNDLGFVDEYNYYKSYLLEKLQDVKTNDLHQEGVKLGGCKQEVSFQR